VGSVLGAPREGQGRSCTFTPHSGSDSNTLSSYYYFLRTPILILEFLTHRNALVNHLTLFRASCGPGKNYSWYTPNHWPAV